MLQPKETRALLREQPCYLLKRGLKYFVEIILGILFVRAFSGLKKWSHFSITISLTIKITDL